MNIHFGFNISKVEKLSFPMKDVTSAHKVNSGLWQDFLITGSTDSIKELVRNAENYRARVRFKNLRYGVVDGTRGVRADILAIEIVKVK